MKPVDLLRTALHLLNAGRGKPTQTNLRRACSTAYYALFHTLCRTCANIMIGKGAAQRTKRAWTQVYRAVEHNTVKTNCLRKDKIKRFPAEIHDFANQFIQMQEKRHRADYDPHERFYKSSVRADIDAVKVAIQGFVDDRRAFAAYVLFKLRDQ